VNKNPTDATVCRYLFTAKLLYINVNKNPTDAKLCRYLFTASRSDHVGGE